MMIDVSCSSSNLMQFKMQEALDVTEIHLIETD